jgi:ABC-type antimicrobial peptide transport system permease subunit
MVIAHALRTGAAGLLLGVGLGVAAGKLLRSLLAGVQPFDPAAFLAAGALCLVMTAAGCLVPAVRALRVDPATAMRTE